MSNHLQIRPAVKSDIDAMVRLSAVKRADYAKANPLMWRRHDAADENQAQWFQNLIDDVDCCLLVAEQFGQCIGFVIG